MGGSLEDIVLHVQPHVQSHSSWLPCNFSFIVIDVKCFRGAACAHMSLYKHNLIEQLLLSWYYIKHIVAKSHLFWYEGNVQFMCDWIGHMLLPTRTHLIIIIYFIYQVLFQVLKGTLQWYKINNHVYLAAVFTQWQFVSRDVVFFMSVKIQKMYFLLNWFE